jgi:hypothetical protein
MRRLPLLSVGIVLLCCPEPSQSATIFVCPSTPIQSVPGPDGWEISGLSRPSAMIMAGSDLLVCNLEGGGQVARKLPAGSKCSIGSDGGNVFPVQVGVRCEFVGPLETRKSTHCYAVCP